MSRPIMEPSTPHEVGNTKFRTSQLERRPATFPASTMGEFAFFEATTTQTIPSGSDLIVEFDTNYNTNPLVFGTGSDPQILSPNQGIVHIEVKTLIQDVGAVVVAQLAGDLITSLDGTGGVWFWPGNDAINTDPFDPTQEWGYKDIAIAWNDGNTRFILLKCLNAGPGAHDFLYAAMHISFFPCSNDLVQVFP